MKRFLEISTILAGILITCFPVSGQFAHKLQGNLLPWTKVPLITKDEYRFVVIGDLTGGEEEGVFASSVEKINQLAPDFVISVGDLIEGYTFDQKTIDGYWKSFEDRVARLDAPFFYVAGNHDMSNKVLYDNWMKRFGYDYYSFIIGKTLFIVLSTFEPGEKGLSDPQVQYIKKALEAHDPDYPVYVFSHAPLWNEAAKPGYRELMPLLNKLNTTFFNGHIEHYLFRSIDGKQYYQMAKTGGGIGQTNLNMGDFNHILFCTADAKTIKIANILTDGIISPYIVDSSTEKQTEILRSRSWFSITPTVIEGESSPLFSSQIVIHNRGDYPMKVEGKLPVYKKLEILPENISITVPAGSTETIPVTLKNPDNIPVEKLPMMEIEMSAAFNQDGKVIKSGSSKRWFIDNLHPCLSEKEARVIFDCSNPAEVEESWCWKGPDDGNFRFSVWHDSKNIHCHIETSDDVLISDPKNPDKAQDRLYLFFSDDTSSTGRVPVFLDMIAGGNPVIKSKKEIPDRMISGTCTVNGNSLVSDITISRSLLKVNAFRINIGFADLDDTISTDPSVIWWKPKWGSRNDYQKSGIFIIDPVK